MIPLRIKVEANADQPFVVRLRSFEADAREQRTEQLSPFDAALERVGPEGAHYVGEGGPIRILGIDPSKVDGDVLLVNPRRGTADRLIRSSSLHNTFLVTERCDQICLMCSQPPKEHHVDLFSHFETAALLAPEGATIGISGGEPTLFKAQLFEFLGRVLEARPDLSFHVLTNGQHFDRDDCEAIKRIDRGRVVWGIPLYSRDPDVHNEIVGKAGAHEQLLENLALMCRLGAQVELRTVLMRPNADGLPQLARFIASTLPFIRTWAIMQMENIGFGRMNWKTLFYDSSEGFDVVGHSIDLVRSRGIDAWLYNFPLCTVPEPYRHLAPATISDWKRAYREECGGCSLKSRCGGFFEWHPANHGYTNLGAIQ
ncbi:His-Xaa-Ser system radical SAM maturase HxsC [Mesorhizobium loti]|uniref:Radical SAM core domain-containing protein n=1 Tax=Rhizobium loti TaxID=381 RepID=M5AM98_RHILI|nr:MULTISPECIES: His-Xaa-Ser system radical SAM maturase HxsC [Mesorhizobium]ANN60699.1 His-Xaa-Ser system radical SAM maturase HxsC [Mesorhizobium loti NZP2037]OBP81290.1 His-Xaa-Ser system radical SAM maturase HxsC [Mesorhizobium loti]OBP88382.1 His-Xaa-Ser system radical SAM maturase HxsC [Mesorhizobium loti]OBQ69341.1 His-Xaa-Ser system radical SAM maturase HxsC [Mesorhizobium loti]QKC66298.1 His-Xaa-Ser system radical SAM maturase HxsC [Mesorhizobium jarvisii]